MPPIYLLFLFDLLGLCLGEGFLDLGICALAAFLHGVSHGGSDQADSTDSVVVCGNDIVDLIGVAVGINDSNDGDVQLASLCNCVVLLAGQQRTLRRAASSFP